jgi:hypothetical protein
MNSQEALIIRIITTFTIMRPNQDVLVLSTLLTRSHD